MALWSPNRNIVQVRSVLYTDAIHNNNMPNFAVISNNFAVSITAKFSGSQFLFHLMCTGGLNCDGHWGVYVGSTAVIQNFVGTDRDIDYHDANTYSGMFIYDANTTAGTTYTCKVGARAQGCGNDVYLNRDPSGTNNNGRSSLTVFELGEN